MKMLYVTVWAIKQGSCYKPRKTKNAVKLVFRALYGKRQLWTAFNSSDAKIKMKETKVK